MNTDDGYLRHLTPDQSTGREVAPSEMKGVAILRSGRGGSRPDSGVRNQGCKEWAGTRRADGYGVLRKGSLQVRAHRAAWEDAYGPIPDGMDVCHHCDNPPCVEPTHLFLGTALDNMQDASRKGRLPGGTGQPAGERHPLSKLTDAQVSTIRASYGGYRGHPNQYELAAAFGVTQPAISMILGRARRSRSST